MFVRAYLRASTEDQDANRARGELVAFAEAQGLEIAAFYPENESGASLQRPELFRLLNDCQVGDVLLIEQVDRLSRLNAQDWETLRKEIKARGVRIVALDLPTSWMSISADETTSRLMSAVNEMLLDMLAAIARKDYDDRRRRQAQGIVKAKASGQYKGRKEDEKRNAGIRQMLAAGMTWTAIQKATKCSRSTISRIKNQTGAGPQEG